MQPNSQRMLPWTLDPWQLRKERNCLWINSPEPGSKLTPEGSGKEPNLLWAGTHSCWAELFVISKWRIWQESLLTCARSQAIRQVSWQMVTGNVACAARCCPVNDRQLWHGGTQHIGAPGWKSARTKQSVPSCTQAPPIAAAATEQSQTDPPEAALKLLEGNKSHSASSRTNFFYCAASTRQPRQLWLVSPGLSLHCLCHLHF